MPNASSTLSGSSRTPPKADARLLRSRRWRTAPRRSRHSASPVNCVSCTPRSRGLPERVTLSRRMRTALLIAAAACASAPRLRPERTHLQPLLLEAIRFPTDAGNDQARLDQQQWLLRTAASLGLAARDAGPVTEIELPGPPGAPVLGLVVLPANLDPGSGKPWVIEEIDAGLAPSIVPDLARITLRWREGTPAWEPLEQRLRARTPAPGTTLEIETRGPLLDVVVHGRAAHAGVNVEGGRNALVSLAQIVAGELPDCALADVVAFAAHAGADLKGAALGLDKIAAPGWRGWTVNVATLKKEPGLNGKLALVINLRRPPPLTATESKERLYAEVRKFSPRLEPGEIYFGDEPLVFDRNAKIVRRLMDDYQRATGEHPPPAISGGGTYAKRIPNAIAYGMWFPGKPYTGHDVDEKIEVADLERGLDVLVETLRDLASGPPLQDPFLP